MQRLRNLSDAEKIKAFDHVLDLIIDCYELPVRPDFQKYSRAAQLAYDIQVYLLREKILTPGSKYRQEKLNL